MIRKKIKNSAAPYLVVIAIAIALFLLLTEASYGQTTAIAQNETGKVQEDKTAAVRPVFTEYRGITIGMTEDRVRDILDEKPKVDDDTGLYYVFSDNESAQIGLDADEKVTSISIDYSGDKSGAPAVDKVLGADIAVVPDADGRYTSSLNTPKRAIGSPITGEPGKNLQYR